LWERGFSSIVEFPLPCARRADVFAMDDAGTMLIVEVKSGVPYFRSDQKWPEYRDWCDLFYFAVDDLFPVEMIPDECGLFIADAFGAAAVRESPLRKIAGARRNSLARRAASTAFQRLHRLEDPMLRSGIGPI